MKKFRNIISALLAVTLIGAYTMIPVYALDEEIEFPEDDEVVEIFDDDEDPDEIIPIDDEGNDPDTETEEEVNDPDVEIVGVDSTPPEDDEPDEVDLSDDTPPASQPSAAQPEATPAYTAVTPYTMYSNEVVNVRYGPDTSYSKLGTVYANSPVKVVGTAGGWLVIEYNGTKGFVSSSFFSQTAPQTTTTAATQAAPAPAQTEAATAATEAETTAAQQEAEIVDEPTTTEKTKAPETEAPETEAPDEEAETTTSNETEDKDKEAAAATAADNDKKNGGLGGILIALGCAVGTFILIGVLPVVIHSIYHKKLYQY